MIDRPTEQSTDHEIDVRAIPREQRHPLIFEAYEQLAVGNALVLVNDHEPRHLREEFDREYARSYAWDPLPASGDEYRARIKKLARTALPRVVADTSALLSATGHVASGAIWRLEPASRGLDSNVIALPGGGEIGQHHGPDLDVLILVLDGSGALETELHTIPLTPGELIWLPHRSRRGFTAGTEGLRYLTLHRRKPTLNISAAPTGGELRPSM